MANISKFKIGASGTEQHFQDAVSDATKYLKMNTKGNLELSNDVEGVSDDSKVNILSKSDIQVKPGLDGTIQFDIEKSATSQKFSTEASFKVCRGDLGKEVRVVDTKWNTTKWTFDTQKGHAGADKTDFIMQWRLDKWNDGQPASDKGPISVKLKAKSFDLRCHGTNPGGGIALQPSGCDTNGKENKIKFESSRTTTIDAATPAWGTEGGKGLEFGTFNNLHTSVFTGDYRFRANAPVYAAVRGALVTESGKTDYPTQSDDFKDILPEVPEGESAITWADVINVVRYTKTLEAYQTWLSTNKLTVAAVGVDGFDENNMQHPTHTVTFSCTNGSVGATVDGVGIQSPAQVAEGKSVVFTITPNEGYEYTGTNPESVVVNADVTKSYECTPVTP